MTVRGMFRPGMRGYIIPLSAGIVLAASAFLPWIEVDDVAIPGFPDIMALWIVGLGLLAAVLATLSLWTRKNSRHPLLVVGLMALGIMFLSWRLMPRVMTDRALTRSQALAIVENTPVRQSPTALAGSGIYVGLAASTTIVGFGLTIVVKRASKPYAVDIDDDV